MQASAISHKLNIRNSKTPHASACSLLMNMHNNVLLYHLFFSLHHIDAVMSLLFCPAAKWKVK
jgi:hypothetical protein